MGNHASIDLILSAVDKITGPLRKITEGVNRVGEAAEKSAGKFTRLQNQTSHFTRQAKQLEGLGRPIMNAGIAGAVGFGLAAKKAADFETAMLGVAKQVDGARDKNGKLTAVYYDMVKQIQLLGRELPIPTSEIAEMVAAGARMGVARDELIKFTKTSAMMSSAFDMPAGELAEKMGQVAKLFDIPIPEIGKLADTINYLDDNALSKGGDIIEVMKRIGGTAKFVKMPENEAAALASTFLTLGSTAEIAATASNAVMRELSIAAMQPKKFQEGLSSIGMTAKQVQAGMVNDATGTIQKVLAAINKLPEASRLTVATQLFGKEYGDDIAKLAAGVGEYNRQLNLARSSDAVGSMLREHEARMESTTAQWQRFKNRLDEVLSNIGAALLPTLNEALLSVMSLTSGMADFAKAHPGITKLIAGFTGLALAGGGFLVFLSKVGPFIQSVAGGLAALARISGMVSGGIRAAMAVFRALQIVMALMGVSLGPVLVGIVALAGAAFLIYKNWGPISKFFTNIWKTVVDLGGKMYQAGAKIVTMLFDGIKSMAMKPVEAIKDIVQKIRNHLPFSPAKVGPLRDLHRIRLVETIAETMKPGPMVKAMRTATAATMMVVSSHGAAAAAGHGGSGVINVYNTVNVAPGSGPEVRKEVEGALKTSERDIEKMLQRILDQHQRKRF
ncbi:MAG: phage tail tape measure protein [Chlorobiaceae bacterium]|nr:phage tail tape measure protein [Chlorobiaceae bacterium]